MAQAVASAIGEQLPATQALQLRQVQLMIPSQPSLTAPHWPGGQVGVQPQTPAVPPPPQVTPVPVHAWPQLPQLLVSLWRFTGVPAQVPFVQTSLQVDALPSSHGVVFGLAGLEQTPALGLQVPAVWHWSLAVQTTGVPAQLPLAWQTSLMVHLRPSSQGAPTFTVRPQAPAEQTALWQTSVAWGQSDADPQWQILLPGRSSTQSPEAQSALRLHELPTERSLAASAPLTPSAAPTEASAPPARASRTRRRDC